MKDEPYAIGEVYTQLITTKVLAPRHQRPGRVGAAGQIHPDWEVRHRGDAGVLFVSVKPDLERAASSR